MKTTCAGIILAGGQNIRMGGRNKAFLRLGGRYFLDRIIDTLSNACCELLLATREPALYSERDLIVVEDILQVRSPLTGIHAGLVNMQADYAFCTSCDTPLLKNEIVQILIDEIEPGYDVIIPASGTYYQPTCAVYARRCIPFIEEQLNLGDLKTDHLYEKIELKKIPYAKFEAVDPELSSFFNVNTPEDIYLANRLLRQKSLFSK
ncbi:MAG: molybdenum cofactor guanylyltransferase [Desulfobacterales bacterium]|nr:MAG: molybdenum cofactor guanylyltransferase [Desulfobacterales bacterium]